MIPTAARFLVFLDRGSYWLQFAAIGDGDGLTTELGYIADAYRGLTVMLYDRTRGRIAMHPAEAWPEEIRAFCGSSVHFADDRAGAPA